MICPDFSGLKILVVGDPMSDVYHFGRVERVSPEAPVPVFIEESYQIRDGGAANVAHQLMALGCGVKFGWQTDVWTEKHRYVVGSHQCFRVDKDLCVPNLIPALDGCTAIVISDYAKGACTFKLCQEVIQEAKSLEIPVVVDPKGTWWTNYHGATVICPNHLELFDHLTHQWGADHLTYQWGADHLIVKRGDRGLSLYSGGDPRGTDFPATARHVFDVTGAGDSVVAVIAACVAAKVDLPTACKLANLAAGYVVGEVGTTTCSIEKLRELCESAS